MNSFQKSYKSSENAKLYDISNKKQLLFVIKKGKMTHISYKIRKSGELYDK